MRSFYEFCPSLALEGHFFSIFIKFLFLMRMCVGIRGLGAQK